METGKVMECKRKMSISLKYHEILTITGQASHGILIWNIYILAKICNNQYNNTCVFTFLNGPNKGNFYFTNSSHLVIIQNSLEIGLECHAV